MKLTLVKPKLGHSADGSYRDKAVMEPLALAIVAALTPPDVEVAFHDERVEPIPFDAQTDLVALTVETFTAKRSYEISAEYRKRGVPVILGGYHPTHLPEEAGLHADSVYLGDAEDLWSEVIRDARTGALQPRYRARTGMLQRGVLPRRDIFKGKKYLPITLVQFSRGCSFDCSFCSVSTFYERTFFHRPVREVIDEIERQERSLILFVDDNIVMNHQVAKELFRDLPPLGIKWFSEGDINMSNDRELMGLMVRSGCKGHLIGFESVEEASLRAMRKHPNLSRFSRYREQLEVLRDHGLLLWAAFTLGHEHDTKETFERTLEFCMEQKFALADFNVLMPYPNTPLYRQLEEECRLLFDGAWWLHPDFRFGKSAFLPHNMTPEELSEGCYRARREYFKIRNIARRAFDLKTNMGSFFNAWIYVLVNSLSYNDGLKKQDILLGGG
ncbi:MAG: B12-binding domain-containing radical SAM protein [Deltaproteobacteria bacterium]|nr:B12-binding domain-containing radical SAM protein [Deltaproteobacteria bacterium]